MRKFSCFTVSAGIWAVREPSHHNWWALKMETFTAGSWDSQESVNSMGCHKLHSSPAPVNVKHLAAKQTWKTGSSYRDSQPPQYPSPTPTASFGLKIFKVVTDIILIGWYTPPPCIWNKHTNAVEACAHTYNLLCGLQWFRVSTYCSQCIWLLNLMDFSLQVTWECYVNTDEKPMLPICIEILSPRRPSTSITINQEITMWHVNKAKGISSTDFCLKSQACDHILIKAFQPLE